MDVEGVNLIIGVFGGANEFFHLALGQMKISVGFAKPAMGAIQAIILARRAGLDLKTLNL